MMDSTKWMGIGAAAVVALVSLGAMFFSARQTAPTPQLPAIQKVDVPAGFVGQQRFGLWTLICENLLAPGAAPGTAPSRVCRTNARMMVNAGNRPVLAAGFNVLMMKSQTGAAMLFRLPPGARAAANINFAIDGNSAFKAPLRCSANDCIAQGTLPPEALEQLNKGSKLSLFYTVKDKQQKNRTVRVDQLLHGFPESFEAMKRAMAA